VNEQRISPPTAAPCPRPRPWDTYLVSEVPGVTAPVAKSLAAVDIRLAKQLYLEIESGIALIELKGVGKVTDAKIRAGIAELRESVVQTENLRNEYAK